VSGASVPEIWIDAARQGFVDAWQLMASKLPDGAYNEVDGLAMSATGLSISGCNTVMVTRMPANPAAALRAARSFFGNRKLPWALYAADEYAEVIGASLTLAGLRRSYPEPAMFLRPEDMRQPARPAGLTVQVIENASAMSVYRRTAASGFGGDEAGFAIWASPDLLETPGLRFYLGLLDGEPVATSCAYALHGIATVNMVSVLPAHRRKGIGEFMTWRAAVDGITMGSEAAFLHASDMGFPVYQRMGFKTAFTYHIWTSAKPY
jgi:N-acetylglutamate synthase